MFFYDLYSKKENSVRDLLLFVDFDTPFFLFVCLFIYLISASSRTPPNDMRWNFLERAVAIDLPSVVLPTPG